MNIGLYEGMLGPDGKIKEQARQELYAAIIKNFPELIENGDQGLINGLREYTCLNPEG